MAVLIRNLSPGIFTLPDALGDRLIPPNGAIIVNETIETVQAALQNISTTFIDLKIVPDGQTGSLDSSDVTSLEFAAVKNALAAADSSVSFNSQKITSVANPTAPQDAATKAYVDTSGAAEVPQTRNLTAGAGLTGGGNLTADRTFDVVANADGSMVVNANDIQVGVLATDGQHGSRSGGTLHANVVAAGAAGFMSGSDKSKLDGIETGAQVTTFAHVQSALSGATSSVALNSQKLSGVADPTLAQDAATKNYVDTQAAGEVPAARTITAGTGLTGGGDLSANRTVNVIANADGSIIANADDIQVGILATDAQHGPRGGGTQHSNVVAAGAAGFMTGSDKSKLDGIETGAQVTSFARVQTALAAASSSVSINSQKITNLADPTLAQDAATKNYVDGYLSKDFLLYVSAINGSDANDGFQRDLALFAGGTTQTPTVFSGTGTTVETAGGSTVLALTPSDPALVGKELVLYKALPTTATATSPLATRQARLITGNTATGFTVTPAFTTAPVLGDTFAVTAPVKTYDTARGRIPASWGKKCQIILASEGGSLAGQTGAAATTAASPAGFPFITINGLTGMTANSVGNLLSTTLAVAAGNNGDAFPIVTFNSSTSVDIMNPSAVAGGAAITWVELQGYATALPVTRIRSGNPTVGGSGNNGASSFTHLGDFVDDYGTQTTTAATATLLTVGGGITGFVSGTISTVAAQTAAQLPPAAGQKLTSSVALTPGAHNGKELLITGAGLAAGLSREIVFNDATDFYVSPAFPATIYGPVVGGADTFQVDSFGSYVYITSGAAIGQMRKIKDMTSTTVTPSIPFNPAPIAGATFSILRPSVKIRYHTIQWLSPNMDIYKGIEFKAILPTSVLDMGLPGGNVFFDSCTMSFRESSGIILNSFSSLVAVTVGSFSFSDSSFADGIRNGGLHCRSGIFALRENTFAVGEFTWSNVNGQLFNHSLIRTFAMNGRGSSYQLADDATWLWLDNAGATLQGTLNKGRNTTANTRGIIDVDDNSKFIGSGANGAVNNLIINNSANYGILLQSFGRANLNTVTGTSTFGTNTGVGVQTQSNLQIRNPATTLTGVGGDVAIGLQPGTGTVAFIKSYTTLNQTKGFSENISISSLGPRSETTGGSTTVLTDSSLALTTNDFTNAIAHVITGAAAGQRRVVTSNTATSFTVAVAFGAAIAIGDQWEILPNYTGNRVEVVTP